MTQYEVAFMGTAVLEVGSVAGKEAVPVIGAMMIEFAELMGIVLVGYTVTNELTTSLPQDEVISDANFE